MKFPKIRRWHVVAFSVAIVVPCFWQRAAPLVCQRCEWELGIPSAPISKSRQPRALPASEVLGAQTGRPWEDVPQWEALTPREQISELLSKRLALLWHGSIETLELARDELFVPKVGAGLTVVPQQPDATSLLRKAEDLAASSGSLPQLVFYRPGAERNEANRRILNGRILLHAKDSFTALQAAELGGYDKAKPIDGLPGYALVEDRRMPGASLLAAASLSKVRGIDAAQPLLGGWLKKASAPTKATYFSKQWHLQNTGQLAAHIGMDANVLPAWNAGYKGKGVIVGIVDDALQVSHPDLQPNYISSASTDLVAPHNLSNRADPSNAHGTSVAGVVAGSGIGSAGVAPEASIAGIWLLGDSTDPEDEAMEASAFVFKNDVISVKNNSWAKPLDARSLGTLGPIVVGALEEATTHGRNGKGEILVFAAGNDYDYLGLQGNKSGFANNVNVLAVSAVTAFGRFAYYSEYGAHVVACAPSSGSFNEPSVVTTDRFLEPLPVGGQDDIGYNAGHTPYDLANVAYTENFSGTSSAAAVTSGVVALMLQANPSLGWRDVKEILLRSGTQMEPTSPEWVTRQGGRPSVPWIKHHPKYGGGLVNAASAVSLAKTWSNLDVMETRTVANSSHWDIPDASSAGVATSVEVPMNFSDQAALRVETVEVQVDLRHTARGDVTIDLISPGGTVSHLAYYSDRDRADSNLDASGYQNWVFSSARHWGESSNGIWKVVFTDLRPGDTGSLEGLTVRLHGVNAPKATIDTVASTQDSIFPLGSAQALRVVASGIQDRTVQWQKGNTTLAKGSSETLAIPVTSAATAGSYTVKVSNLTGDDQTVMNIGTVDTGSRTVTVNEDNQLTLQAIAAGPGITYRWTKNGVAMDDIPQKIIGTTTKTLVVKSATTSDADEYACQVSVGRARSSTGVFEVHVRVKPQIAAFEFPPTIVSGSVAVRVPLLDPPVGVDGSATQFIITGLPAGLSYNAKTGWITGQPTAGSTTPAKVTITVLNPAGQYSVTKDFQVEPPVPTTVGIFYGLAAPDSAGNDGLGGTVSLACSSTGVFSGRVLLGNSAYALAGRLDASLAKDPKGTVTILRAGKLAPLQVSFEIARENGHLTGTVANVLPPFSSGQAVYSIGIEGWRNPYSKPSSAGALAAMYNGWMEPPDTPPSPGAPLAPEGVSCFTLTVNSAGAGTWIQRTADGQFMVGTTNMVQGGHVPMHITMYGGTGSIHGWSQITEVATPGLNTMAGSIRWTKKSQSSASVRSYKDGFTLNNMTLSGEKYSKPTSGTVLWGLRNQPGKSNANLLFARAGVETTANFASINSKTLYVAPAPAVPTIQQVQVPPPNPSVIYMRISTDSGWFSGTATLRETTPTVVVRRLDFAGVTCTGARRGRGYFILPDMPGISTSPLLSGLVELVPDPNSQ